MRPTSVRPEEEGRGAAGVQSGPTRRIGRRRLAVAAAVLPLLTGTVLAASLGAGTSARADGLTASTATKPPDPTSQLEKKRVDSVPTPKLDWYTCSTAYDEGQCASVKLPRDYDRPKGRRSRSG
ncbi:hypothetical protein FOE78_13150 [Microlunatus elymi]|uniref:Uncharacterized protein n=1 Tax=Microlunatus elymi TaxID=2596828 RepID=A0A516PZX0_9ACTN|nr:hypothetical protein [Microlunatus elymi]QDP96729.1 hypothetical protein FOE78_13150 [Microlunatus elymi]